MATIETERLLCEVKDDVARVWFRSTAVAEYTQAESLPADFKMIADGYNFSIMVVDCDALDFVTSTFLSALVACHKFLEKHGRKLRACNLNPLITSMFRTTRLDTVVKVYPTLAAAMEP